MINVLGQLQRFAVYIKRRAVTAQQETYVAGNVLAMQTY